MNLQNIFDRNKYKGIIALSDIHGEFQRLIDAVEYADRNDLFIVFIGDLIDGGKQPRETLLLVRELLENSEAVLTIGNHDWKHFRGAIGNPVVQHLDYKETLVNAGDEEQFKELITDIVPHPNADYCHYFGKTIFAHGAVRASVWEFPEELSKAQRFMALYGEPNGETDENGFPVRVYNWVEDIPTGHQAVVGHDVEALGKNKSEPLQHVNSNGGTVFFTDTSCGKHHIPDHHLTGAVFLLIENELEFMKFEAFV